MVSRGGRQVAAPNSRVARCPRRRTSAGESRVARSTRFTLIKLQLSGRVKSSMYKRKKFYSIFSKNRGVKGRSPRRASQGAKHLCLYEAQDGVRKQSGDCFRGETHAPGGVSPAFDSHPRNSCGPAGGKLPLNSSRAASCRTQDAGRSVPSLHFHENCSQAAAAEAYYANIENFDQVFAAAGYVTAASYRG